jgi:hypothetical protein
MWPRGAETHLCESIFQNFPWELRPLYKGKREGEEKGQGEEKEREDERIKGREERGKRERKRKRNGRETEG